MPATCRTNWPTAGCHRINEAARNIYFAWSGGISPSAPRYYRIQTPSFLIEFDDTQDNANHIHSVWRDFTGDFGEDLLQQHYAASHGDEHMDIIALLKAERDKAAQKVNALDTAIRALSGLNSTRVSHGPRKMSAAARARISASQKARWAKAKSQKVVPIKAGKRHISPAGLARIRAATKARWARWRQQKKAG